MGQTWSCIPAVELRKQCQSRHDIAVALLVINLNLLILSTFIYWIPRACYAFIPIGIVTVAFSTQIASMSRTWEGGWLLTSSHQAFSFALLGLAIAGTVSQQNHINNYKPRYSGNYYYNTTNYDNNYHRNSSYYYYYDDRDPWSSNGYMNLPAAYILAISFPILYFKKMIIFSFACAAVFNRALAERDLHRPVYSVPGRAANGANPVIISREMIGALQAVPVARSQLPPYTAEGGSSHSPV